MKGVGLQGTSEGIKGRREGGGGRGGGGGGRIKFKDQFKGMSLCSECISVMGFKFSRSNNTARLRWLVCVDGAVIYVFP